MTPNQNHAQLWKKFAGELIVPVLLCGYGTHYYISVTKLPRPETNLLLVGPVYWILVISSVLFALIRLYDTVKQIRLINQNPDANVQQAIEQQGQPDDESEHTLFRSIAFIVLTIACAWLIPVLGFVVTIVSYTFLLLWVLGVRSWPLLVLTPTLLAGSLWASMELFLNLRLPTGLFL